MNWIKLVNLDEILSAELIRGFGKDVLVSHSKLIQYRT